MGRMYRVGEVAALTRLSVRTLRHYDRIGLLRPSAYSEGGHRLYAEDGLLRLQQILTLRYLGFPLKQIGALLGRADFDLLASMRVQRGALRDRIAELERIEAVLGELIERRLATGRWAWDLVVRASATVQDVLAQRGEAMERMQALYTPEQLKQFEELRERFPAEERVAIEQRWTALLADVRANLGVDPASPTAQALVRQWNALTEATLRGWPDELKAAVGENYRQGRFADQPGVPDPEVFAFIGRANAARTDTGAAE